MLNDQNLVLSSAQAIANSVASTNCYDILNGAPIPTAGGTYVVPPGSIIGNATFFGEDLGTGFGRGMGTPVVMGFTGPTTPSGFTSLQVRFQGAQDNGGGTIAGLSFVDYDLTPAVPLASIAASIRLFEFALPRRQVGTGLPRFLQLFYTVNGGAAAGLTVTSFINLGDSSAQNNLGNYAANY